jgi:hypothetical protein
MSAMTDETERSNESRITVLETRFDDIVPSLATRSDLRELAARFDAVVPTLATKSDLRELAAQFDAVVPTLATKADLAESERRVRSDLGEVDKTLSSVFAEQKGGWEAILPTLATNADLASAMVKMQRWMITTMLAIILSNAATLYAAINLMRHG